MEFYAYERDNAGVMPASPEIEQAILGSSEANYPISNIHTLNGITYGGMEKDTEIINLADVLGGLDELLDKKLEEDDKFSSDSDSGSEYSFSPGNTDTSGNDSDDNAIIEDYSSDDEEDGESDNKSTTSSDTNISEFSKDGEEKKVTFGDVTFKEDTPDVSEDNQDDTTTGGCDDCGGIIEEVEGGDEDIDDEDIDDAKDYDVRNYDISTDDYPATSTDDYPATSTMSVYDVIPDNVVQEPIDVDEFCSCIEEVKGGRKTRRTRKIYDFMEDEEIKLDLSQE